MKRMKKMVDRDRKLVIYLQQLESIFVYLEELHPHELVGV